MENKVYLGIYIAQNSATVVAISLSSGTPQINDTFVVNIDEDQPHDPAQLAEIIKQSCSEKNISFDQAFVALDSSLYNQHQIHSDFHDYKQISSTVRFDTEEAVASDISDIALAFDIDREDDETGTDLNVYTAKTKTLKDILSALKNNNINPTSIEPDICSLTRFITSATPPDAGELYALLSQNKAYVFVPRSDADKKHAYSQSLLNRSFLISSSQARNSLLKTQIPITISLSKHDLDINKIKTFDSTDSLDYVALSETQSCHVEKFALNDFLTENKLPDDNPYDKTDIAIAVGAALAAAQKHTFVNFRDDFSPYMDKKLQLQNALKTVSIAASIAIFALGLFFQLKLLKLNNYTNAIDKKVKDQYATVMFNKKPSKRSSPLTQLKSELKRIKDVKSGQLSLTGTQSIPAKLTLILDALNAIAAQTSLNVETISVTTKTMSVSGDTSNRNNTLKLIDSIKKKQMDVSRQSHEKEGSRDKFNINLKIEKGKQ